MQEYKPTLTRGEIAQMIGVSVRYVVRHEDSMGLRPLRVKTGTERVLFLREPTLTRLRLLGWLPVAT